MPTMMVWLLVVLGALNLLRVGRAELQFSEANHENGLGLLLSHSTSGALSLLLLSGVAVAAGLLRKDKIRVPLTLAVILAVSPLVVFVIHP